MSNGKRVLVCFGLLLTVSAAVAAGELPQLSSPVRLDCAAAQSSWTPSSLPETPPTWLAASSGIPCGAGCPLSGEGTEAVCVNKNAGDPCGFDAICLHYLTPSCPPPYNRCICVPR